MNPVTLLETYYPPGTTAHSILLPHSIRVAEMAAAIARRLSAHALVDATFVEEAALLHDIGILHTDAPQIGCHGRLPYLCHGFRGREILERHGLPRHALVCERHIGVGLSAEEIRARNLPLPSRDMSPLTVEEKIVTYADLFFSKNPDSVNRERQVEEIRRSLARFGDDKVTVFDAWHLHFTR